MVLGGGRVGTLLGPEASGPRSLSHQMLCGVSRVVWVGWVVWTVGSGSALVGGGWLLSFVCWSAVAGWWGLVGLLFEICIVDASIN